MAVTRHRINIGLKFGPYASRDAAIGVQEQMKKKSPGIKFTGIRKVGKAYKFDGKMSFVEAVDATSRAVKQYTQQRVPAGAVVTVDNLSRKNTKKRSW